MWQTGTKSEIRMSQFHNDEKKALLSLKFTVSSGSSFQSLIVFTKKELAKVVVLNAYSRILCVCWHLVERYVGASRYSDLLIPVWL